ncbi:MAG: hypothetical protein ACXQTV_01290 [Candidatus Hecatellaceae archaeon]
MAPDGVLPVPLHKIIQSRAEPLLEAIRKFFRDERLSFYELNLLRWYIYQWVSSHPRKPNNYFWIRNMSQKELKKYVLEVLVKRYGILPF